MLLSVLEPGANSCVCLDEKIIGSTTWKPKGLVQIGSAHHRNTDSMKAGCLALSIPYRFLPSISEAKEWFDSAEESEAKRFDAIWLPSGFIDPEVHPWVDRKIMYGPHDFVFPKKDSWIQQTDKNPPFRSGVFYNALSAWNLEVLKGFTKKGFRLPLYTCPFGVAEPAPSIFNKRDKRMIILYFKHRDRALLISIQEYLKRKYSLKLEVLIYEYGKYQHEAFCKDLSQCDAAIWIGCHESQGFAFQDVLMHDKPIFCWDVKTMYDERNENGRQMIEFSKEETASHPLFATSATCFVPGKSGECIHSAMEFCRKFPQFLERLHLYAPKSTIQPRLSLTAAMERLFHIWSVAGRMEKKIP